MFTGVRLQGYRSYEDSGVQPLSAMTVVIGKNNTGKSTVLRAIYQIQQGAPWADDDIRLGHAQVRIELDFDRLAMPCSTIRAWRRSGEADGC
jgi:predicted ATP-dependent endonuclease of OLD family